MKITSIAPVVLACLIGCSREQPPRTPAPPRASARDATADPGAPQRADAGGDALTDALPDALPGAQPLDAAALARVRDELLERATPRSGEPLDLTRADRASICDEAEVDVKRARTDSKEDTERTHRVRLRALDAPWRCTALLLDVLDRPETYALEELLAALTTLRRASHRDDISRALTPQEDARVTSDAIALLAHENKTIRRAAAAALSHRGGGEDALRAAILTEADVYARETMEATLARKAAGR